MRILIFHGYLLRGTGSNIYNANLARALAGLGHEVHLFCQDRAAREMEGVTIHAPDIGRVLPVYVADRYEGFDAMPFPELDEAALGHYLDVNVAAIRSAPLPDIALANHLVMGPLILARAMERQVEEAPDKQVSLTDPDARSMATSGKGTGIVGYNVQIAVDAEHHLIVAHEVTNVGTDRAQLAAMGGKARDATGCEELTVLADRGYYNGEEVLACEGTGVLPYVPKTQTSGNAKRGLFTVQDFIYDAENDRYTCPAGEFLTKGKIRSDRRDDMDHYRNLTACLTCGLKSQCTADKVKRQKRWEHEAVLDRMQARLDRMPEAMIIRRQTVEHPFGTLKAWMGSTHFLTKTLEKVKTEMSLQVLAYNMKRMINIFGVKPLMQAIAG